MPSKSKPKVSTTYFYFLSNKKNFFPITENLSKYRKKEFNYFTLKIHTNTMFTSKRVSAGKPPRQRDKSSVKTTSDLFLARKPRSKEHSLFSTYCRSSPTADA